MDYPSKNEAKKLQISWIYDAHVVDSLCLNCCLLEFTSRKLRCSVFKILNIARFQIKTTYWTYGGPQVQVKLKSVFSKQNLVLDYGITQGKTINPLQNKIPHGNKKWTHGRKKFNSRQNEMTWGIVK